jgi:hypothetical protein
MDPASTELAKYASNVMLAARLSFMNELSRLCERTGANIEHISQALGSNPRVGVDFLNAGIGYGGSCLPKDIAALIDFGNSFGCEMAKAIRRINIDRHKRFVRRITERFKGRQVKLAVWGFAFKTGTDDIRNSAAVYCIEKLLKKGFEIRAYDPLASFNASKIYKDKIAISGNRYDVLDGADALVIFMDAPEFKKANLKLVSSRVKVIFDGRNLFEPADLGQFGIKYHSVGRKFAEIPEKAVTFLPILHLKSIEKFYFGDNTMSKPVGINKESLFTIMGKLSVQQRGILSLKYFEDMSLGQVSYILDMEYFRLLLYLLGAKIKLKLLLIMNGYRVIPLKRLMAVFGELTNV